MISPCKFILASVKVPLHISLASYNVIIVYFLLFLAQLKKTDGFDNILTLAPNWSLYVCLSDYVYSIVNIFILTSSSIRGLFIFVSIRRVSVPSSLPPPPS